MTDLKTKEKLFKIECANDFINRTREDIKSASKSFFLIGFRLNEANEQEYYKVLGYDSIEALAEDKFGFGRSTTYGFINVFRRFAERNEHGFYSTFINQIKPEFKDYDYSKLVEIQKIKYIPCPIEKYIPPQSSVRAIQGYVKYYNQQDPGGHHETLPEWQKKQNETNNSSTTIPTQANNQLAGQVTINDVVKPNEPAKNIDTTSQTQTVQTFGLPTSAESKEIKEYDLTARKKVREFLNDYKNWRLRKNLSDDFFLQKVYSYEFKSHQFIYAVEQFTYGKGELELGKAQTEITYYLNAFTGDGVTQITKEQIEQFCSQHKGEL
ncbi:MAG: hypothetical protein IJA89_08935 [Clostridia bacterium]|nr:hypothetical protein [Clostridia bacterium]